MVRGGGAAPARDSLGRVWSAAPGSLLRLRRRSLLRRVASQWGIHWANRAALGAPPSSTPCFALLRKDRFALRLWVLSVQDGVHLLVGDAVECRQVSNFVWHGVAGSDLSSVASPLGSARTLDD